MFTPSDLLQRVQESATLKMTRLARELKNQGHEVISLSIGEPDFNTPEEIKKAAWEALENNMTKYPPVNGFLALREAICAKLERENKVLATPEQVVVSTGAKQSLINLLLAIVNPEDEVILPTPFWVSYPEMVHVTGGKVIRLETNIQSGFKVTAAQLREAITPKTKVVIISSPSNPTGAMYSPEEMKALVDVIAQHPQVTLIADEIYEYITYEHDFLSFGTFTAIQDQLVLVNGVSKGFAMTGWRLGFCVAPLPIAQACTKIQGQFTSGASTVSQMAAKKAFEMGKEPVQFMRDAFRTRRDYLVQELNKIDGITCLVPDGAFYLYPNIQELLARPIQGKIFPTDEALCLALLEEAHVALVPGSAFGTPGYIRLSYATDLETLKTAISRIKNFLA